MMPRRLVTSFTLLIGLAAVPLACAPALAQGVLLPPGEVPGAFGATPNGQQPTGNQLFSPQPMAPQMGAPRAAAPAASGAPQIISPQAGGPQASAPAAQATVPLPQQRPASANQPRPASPGPAAPAAVAAAPRSPLANPAPAPAQGNLDRAAMTTVNKLTTYWNSVQTLVGTFVQIDSDGSRKTGDFYMQKPGRVRFEYNAPATIELVSNGQSVVVRDRRLNTQDVTPLAQTPLRFLLADKIELVQNPNVLGVYEDNVYVSVVMQEQVPMMGTYRLLLLFDAKDYQLKQWIVTDPQGYDTSVAISNLNYTARPDPKLFNINFERMLQ